uniref:BHLH domain-containing protein n=1 Tax=Tetraodon nigroviridis TaxID=99883 RepID=H3D8H8_TETNG
TKPFQDPEASSSRKRTLKHHVERRRRERINRSLDSLKSLLLLPQLQEAAERRVEKAEILEHTVVFLQRSRAQSRPGAAGGTQKDSFREGFSDCLERAAGFLGPRRKGPHLRAALQPPASAAFPRPDFAPAGWRSSSHARPSSGSRLLRSSCTSILPSWLREPGPVKPGQSGRPLPPQQRRTAASKQSPLQGQPAPPSLWRPWP